MKTLGLIRGMSWESSAVYYQIINRRAKELLGGSHSARSLMYSVDFADVEKRQHDENWADLELIMIDAAQRLERGGANFIVICTNTMHIFADQIEASVNIPLLHIGDATGEALQRAGIRKAALFGTKFTMERPFLRDRLEERCGIETIIPSASDREMIHSVIYGELVK